MRAHGLRVWRFNVYDHIPIFYYYRVHEKFHCKVLLFKNEIQCDSYDIKEKNIFIIVNNTLAIYKFM